MAIDFKVFAQLGVKLHANPKRRACVAGKACAADPYFRKTGKRPATWDIGDNGPYCADCLNAVLQMTRRLNAAR